MVMQFFYENQEYFHFFSKKDTLFVNKSCGNGETDARASKRNGRAVSDGKNATEMHDVGALDEHDARIRFGFNRQSRRNRQLLRCEPAMEVGDEEAEDVRIELLVALGRAVGVHEMLAEMRGVKLLILSELLGIGYDGVSATGCLDVNLDVPALGIGHGVGVLPDDRQEIELVEGITVVLGVLDVRAASADNDIRAVLLAFLGSV